MVIRHSINDRRTESPAENEIWISFNDDIGAEAFDAWWHSVGYKTFVKWAEQDEYFKQALEDD